MGCRASSAALSPREAPPEPRAPPQKPEEPEEPPSKASSATTEPCDPQTALAELFPTLDRATLADVLERNLGDVEATAMELLALPVDAADLNRRPAGAVELDASLSLDGSVELGLISLEGGQIAPGDLRQLLAWAASPAAEPRFQAAQALCDVSASEANQAAIVREGGAALLLAIARDPPTPEARGLAVGALANVAMADANQQPLFDAGLVPAMVALLRADESVAHAARALANVAFRCERIEGAVAESGAVAELLRVVAESADDEARCECVAVLANLSAHAAAAERIGAEAALALLGQAAALHDAVDGGVDDDLMLSDGARELRRQSLRLLGNLSMASEALKARLDALGAARAVAELWPALGVDERRLAALTLGNLATQPGALAVLREEPTLDALVVLAGRGGEPGAQAVRALLHVARAGDDEFKRGLALRGLLPALVAVDDKLLVAKMVNELPGGLASTW